MAGWKNNRGISKDLFDKVLEENMVMIWISVSKTFRPRWLQEMRTSRLIPVSWYYKCINDITNGFSIQIQIL